jgi:hypothetical protein
VKRIVKRVKIPGSGNAWVVVRPDGSMGETFRSRSEALRASLLPCGHPDELDNLFWHRNERRLLGGSWRCRACHRADTAAYWDSARGREVRFRHYLQRLRAGIASKAEQLADLETELEAEA